MLSQGEVHSSFTAKENNQCEFFNLKSSVLENEDKAKEAPLSTREVQQHHVKFWATKRLNLVSPTETEDGSFNHNNASKRTPNMEFEKNISIFQATIKIQQGKDKAGSVLESSDDPAGLRPGEPKHWNNKARKPKLIGDLGLQLALPTEKPNSPEN